MIKKTNQDPGSLSWKGMKGFIKIIFGGIAGGAISAITILPQKPDTANPVAITFDQSLENTGKQSVYTKNIPSFPEKTLPNDNFISASMKSAPAVVFVQSLSEYEYRIGSWMD